MTVGAVVCYAVAVVAELLGVVLVIREAQRAQRALTHYLELNPKGNPGGSWRQIGDLQPVIVAALGNQARRWLAIGLLVLGVVTGAVGNFLSL